jgi:hypothetical protein
MHPLTNDLSNLSEEELQKKFSELQKKIGQAYRFGPQGIIPQLQMILEDYQRELQERSRKEMEKMMEKAKSSGKDFGNIIDIN